MIKKCIITDCENLTRSHNTDYCEKHYYRLRRNGTTEIVRQAHPTIHSQGYMLLPTTTHPLVRRHTGHMEYEHRIVYYNEHGEGPFKCYWCGKAVDWNTLHIDHLNEVKTDNSIDNLVATCPACNQKRGRHKMVATSRKMRAVWIEHDGRTMTLGEWADLLEISRVSMFWRLSHGWSIERALTEPRGKTGPMSNRERFAVLNAGKPVVMQPYQEAKG